MPQILTRASGINQALIGCNTQRIADELHHLIMDEIQRLNAAGSSDDTIATALASTYASAIATYVLAKEVAALRGIITDFQTALLTKRALRA